MAQKYLPRLNVCIATHLLDRSCSTDHGPSGACGAVPEVLSNSAAVGHSPSFPSFLSVCCNCHVQETGTLPQGFELALLEQDDPPPPAAAPQPPAPKPSKPAATPAKRKAAPPTPKPTSGGGGSGGDEAGVTPAKPRSRVRSTPKAQVQSSSCLPDGSFLFLSGVHRCGLVPVKSEVASSSAQQWIL